MRTAAVRRGVLLAALVASSVVAAPRPSPGAVTVPAAIDVTDLSGIWDSDHLQGWYGTYPYDIDVDGDMDVLLAPHGGPRVFMLNDGTGHFTETQPGTIPYWDRHGCAWADVDRNGKPDVYCAVGADHGSIEKQNELWVQQLDGSFIDQATAYHVLDRWGRGREVAFLDVNHDLWPDLYVTNDYPRKDNHPSVNRLFINQGGTDFRDAPEYGLDRRGGSTQSVHSCVYPADFNADGWEDLLVCGKEGLFLFRNEHGVKFSNVVRPLDVKGGVWHWAELVDMNADGRLDLVGVGRHGFHVQLRGPKGFRKAVTKKFERGTESAAGDVNGDGFPDIYVSRRQGKNGANLPDKLFVNDGSGTHFFLAPLPPETVGAGDSVRAADLNGDGLSEFLVTNGGYGKHGPLRVLTFAPYAP